MTVRLGTRRIRDIGNGDLIEIQPDLQLAPHAVRGFCLLELDRPDEADAAFETGLRQSERGGHVFLTWHYIGRARTRFLTGRWDDAVAEIQAGLAAIDPLGVAPGLQSQAALIAMHRGDFGSYAGLSGKPDTNLGGRYWDFLRVMAQALAWEARGKPGRALDLLMRYWEWDVGRAQPVLMRHLCPDIARLAVTVGASEQARRVAVALDKLAEGHSTPTVRGTAALCRGAADHDADLLLAAAHEYRMAAVRCVRATPTSSPRLFSPSGGVRPKLNPRSTPRWTGIRGSTPVGTANGRTASCGRRDSVAAGYGRCPGSAGAR